METVREVLAELKSSKTKEAQSVLVTKLLEVIDGFEGAEREDVLSGFLYIFWFCFGNFLNFMLLEFWVQILAT